MKKVLSMVGIAILVLLAMTAFGPLAGILGGIYCYKKFMGSPSLGGKIAWAVGGLLLVNTFLQVGTFVNGLLALGALYQIYRTQYVSRITMD
ncbi:MAG: hypothetical protein FWF59_13665 [Turicibacter sp.]|nr:hypothetical protein [Turicibacter sp.]